MLLLPEGFATRFWTSPLGLRGGGPCFCIAAIGAPVAQPGTRLLWCPVVASAVAVVCRMGAVPLSGIPLQAEDIPRNVKVKRGWCTGWCQLWADAGGAGILTVAKAPPERVLPSQRLPVGPAPTLQLPLPPTRPRLDSTCRDTPTRSPLPPQFARGWVAWRGLSCSEPSSGAPRPTARFLARSPAPRLLAPPPPPPARTPRRRGGTWARAGARASREEGQNRASETG